MLKATSLQNNNYVEVRQPFGEADVLIVQTAVEKLASKDNTNHCNSRHRYFSNRICLATPENRENHVLLLKSKIGLVQRKTYSSTSLQRKHNEIKS